MMAKKFLSCFVYAVIGMIYLAIGGIDSAWARTCENLADNFQLATMDTWPSPGLDLKTNVALTKGDKFVASVTATSHFSSSGPGSFMLILENTSPGGSFSHPIMLDSNVKIGALRYSDSFEVSETGSYRLYLFNSEHITLSDVDVRLACAGGNSTAAVQAAATRIAALGQQQMTDMVTGRVRQIRRQFKTPQLTPSKNVTSSGLSHQLNAGNGQNAGAPDYVSGVWGNIALSHVEDSHGPTNLYGLQGILMAGMDRFINEQLLVGAAVNLEHAQLQIRRNDGDLVNTSLGVSPYISWQIDDIFSLTGLANISHIQSQFAETTVADLITSVDMNGVRWSVSATGDGFFSWGNWSLLSSLNLSYGQLSLFETKDNQGNIVDGSTSQTGSVAISLQPSYYWQYDRDLALEPYLLTEYRYDFTMQKIRTATNEVPHPNDEDQIRLGLGLNLFGSQFYSGNIEASAVFGRDKYSETSVSGSLRVQF